MTSNSLSMANVEQAEAEVKKESSWWWLYKLGGAAAMVSVLFIPITIVVYIVWPPADSVVGHFEQFHSNWLVGLLGMDLLYLLTNIILIPTWLALYVALRRTNESLMAVALTLGLVGIVALIAANLITLGFYLPVIGIYISIFSVLFYWIWYLMIARRLWALSADDADDTDFN